ncbi:MAG: T9SS type A sorting domain-containing protein [Bacteroidetes bacterium]|nr:T9SS type A sorting domain-containing protein [Bacteroidota bacterium]
MRCILLLLLFLLPIPSPAQKHHPGSACSSCHGSFALGGTVFTGYESDSEQAQVPVVLYRSDGSRVSLPASDANGRIFASALEDGRYLIRVGNARSHSRHELPRQKDCNNCHIPGGNILPERDLRLRDLHTDLPESNECTPCHHFPASMHIDRLATPGQLTGNAQRAATQGSGVIIRDRTIAFLPDEHAITTIRPDIFVEGYYSLFDVLLSVAQHEGIRIAYHWDDDCQTHFIDSVDGTAGDFWYGFSYDAGSGTQNELRYRRQIRWDELLWQPGSWIRLSTGDDLDALKREFREEIERERQSGSIVPLVQISVNPSDFHGNPPESHRITVTRTFRDVQVTAHDRRAAGSDSLYRMPFRAGVVTALDLLLSLEDQDLLALVGTEYFTHLAGKVMESYRVRSLGFPGEGLAHASGRQGFVYTTGNGTPQRLVNGADGKQHVHADIHVIHAPDFARWRWIELGNPYYEDDDPTGIEELLADYDALDRGFRLQRPWPQPATDELQLSFNVFVPGSFRIELYDLSGRLLRTVFDARIDNVGIHRLTLPARDLGPGIYFLRMTDGRDAGIQKVVKR